MNVMVAEGLRVHICPKVATASISSAMHGAKYHHAFPEESGPEYRWMCIRHPLDRIVSCWAFFCNGDGKELAGQQDFRKLGYRHGMPFDDFLSLVLDKHHFNQHTRKQIFFSGHHKFDRIALFENLEKEWQRLKDKFPYLTKPLIVTHKSDHDAWQTYYNNKQRFAAENVFREDIKLYELGKYYE